jgi:hypothetical protein
LNVETLLAEWADRCRELAQRAREDVERSAAYETLDPDATLRVVRQDAAPLYKN